jgi:hypothetical protein
MVHFEKLHGSMQLMKNGIAYFARAATYECEMFMN